ncbi:hypothetical protein TGS27_1739 [Geobacillus stearothermophilus]|uniref:Uncharacterized protein n=1 Tax=Geobacillus stearothermophilus TaxID=1422 RepID=A0A150MLT3_GEOSE|nr:hypothetical protein B4109_0388 [Geobacillus stearothermophilus]OAO81037.1 hypothetical protein TGS27_1739 [Geobacillus stearothermophilus]
MHRLDLFPAQTLSVCRQALFPPMKKRDHHPSCLSRPQCGAAY